MGKVWSFYRDLLSVVVIIGNECNDMALLTLFKAATLQGMNNFVFVAYTYAIATTILFPFTFFHRRSRVVPPLSFSIICKILLLGVIGMEKVAAKSRSSQAKVIGSIISIAGAFVLTLYKGSSVIKAHSHLPLYLQQPISLLRSGDANWAIGGILLTAEYFLMSVFCILQTDILKVFPDELSLVFFYSVIATILSTMVGFFAVPNASAWKIGLDISLISIVCSGIFGKLMSNVVYAWALHLKGPVFVTSFKPFQVAIAVAMGVVFLGDTLYTGRDILPIVVLVANECSDMGLLTLFKAATLQGMNNHVFVAYGYAVATTILLPVTFFSRRTRVVPPLSFSIISKIVLLGVIGSSSQVLGYTGISYSSPTLASSISNLVPTFTFILAVIWRMEKLAAKSRSSQAKVIGSIISIAGAFVLTFYKGSSIINAHTHIQHPINFLQSEDTSWAIAGILLIGDYLLVSVWYILQVDILKEFPDELTLVFFYNVTATILSTTVGFFAAPNASSWKIGLDISMISIVCSGIFGRLISNVVYAWALHLKGPVYVTSFKPLQVIITIAMGVMFLDDTLYIGSVIGAIIVSIGLYVVLWGKATEEIEEDVGSLESPTTENLPLLQTYRTETSQKNG